MSETLPRNPVPPGAAVPQPRRGPFRRRLSRLRRSGPAAWTVWGSTVGLVALLLVGVGTATARVLPGPGAAAPGPSGVEGRPATTLAGAAGTEAAAAWDRDAAAWRNRDATGAWPLRPEPEVVAGFAPPPVAWAAGHRGVDLLGRPGQQVRAARAGTVTFAGRIAGRGVVVVSHGATRTTYEPVAATVSRGDAVPRGAVLGRLELLGSHCLPRACLHWGLIRGETYLDPLTLVGRGPVRLVPWGGLPGSPAS